MNKFLLAFVAECLCIFALIFLVCVAVNTIAPEPSAANALNLACCATFIMHMMTRGLLRSGASLGWIVFDTSLLLGLATWLAEPRYNMVMLAMGGVVAIALALVRLGRWSSAYLEAGDADDVPERKDAPSRG